MTAKVQIKKTTPISELTVEQFVSLISPIIREAIYHNMAYYRGIFYNIPMPGEVKQDVTNITEQAINDVKESFR